MNDNISIYIDESWKNDNIIIATNKKNKTDLNKKR